MRYFRIIIFVSLLGCTHRDEMFIIEQNPLYYDAEQAVFKEDSVGACSSPQEAAMAAERIFMKYYGRGILSERPWRVTVTGAYYLVTGSLPGTNYCGGVGQLKIGKADGRVWIYYHGE